jgi:hypothetical protein
MDQSFAARSAQREKCSKRSEAWPAQEKRRSLLAHNQHESVILSEAKDFNPSVGSAKISWFYVAE